MIIRYLDPLERLKFEIVQRKEQGSDYQSLDMAYQNLKDKPDDVARIEALNILERLMKDDAEKPILSSDEPDKLEDIKKASSHDNFRCPPFHSLSDEKLYDRLLGGWLGRASGCLLGKPVERYMRPILREMLTSNNNWPLDNYWTQEGMPQDILDKYPWKQRLGWESLRENITCMPEDDDLNYPMLNLHIMETNGYDFNSSDVGTAWLTNLPVFQTFTAERVAYHNILAGLDAPDSATFMNPFREWIGAQIRADLWGYVSPGNPEQAANLAWRDARISHSRNGIYGEMFFAALIAEAFVEQNIRKLVETALTFIPQNSRLAKAIKIVLNLPIATLKWDDVLDELETHFGEYHWVHTINNAALTTAALLAGDGDFEKTICCTVMGGLDTDSNGATAGSIVGIIKGAKSLPEKWISPLNNQIRSSLGGFDNVHFSDLADRTLKTILRSKVQTGDQNSPASKGLSDDF